MIVNPSLQNEKRNKKEISIILAAERVFTKYGYQKTTVKDIGNEVGLNKSSLYHYFKNKEGIFIQVILYQFSKYKDSIQILPKEQPTKLRVYQFLETLLKFMLNYPLSRQALELDFKLITEDTIKKILELRNIRIDYLRSIIKDGIKQNEIRNIDPNWITNTILFLFEGIKRIAKSESIIMNSEMDLEKMLKDVQQSLDILFGGISVKKFV